MSTANADKSVAELKQLARRSLLSNRPGKSDGLTEQLIQLVTELGFRRIGCYVAMKDEPDTLPFVTWAHQNSLAIYTPTIDENAMRWHQYLGDLHPGRYGIRVSSGAEIGMDQLELVLVPALAATPQGKRLGRGGGFYDRAIAALTATESGLAPVFAAIVFDSELLSNLPSEPHDQIMDFVVTPSRTYITKTEQGS
jgi:5-formyltetrahydrofolate cyclo-ligase